MVLDLAWVNIIELGYTSQVGLGWISQMSTAPLEWGRWRWRHVSSLSQLCPYPIPALPSGNLT